MTDERRIGQAMMRERGETGGQADGLKRMCKVCA